MYIYYLYVIQHTQWNSGRKCVTRTHCYYRTDENTKLLFFLEVVVFVEIVFFFSVSFVEKKVWLNVRK